VVQGARFIGDWEERLYKLIDLADAKQQVAVYWPNVNDTITAGKSSVADDRGIADAMAPYIESGKLLVLGECSDQAFHRLANRNPWFEKLFTVFHVHPQPEEVVKEVVRLVAADRNCELQREAGCQIVWSDDGLDALTYFGSIYFPGAAAPGGAIRLLDHCVEEIQTAWESGHRRSATVAVGYQDVLPPLASLTGIPMSILDDSQPLKANDVRRFFEERIIGQPRAISAVVDLIMLIKAGLADPRKPLGILFFSGPTGVGKTELAKTLSEYLFGSRDRLVRLDMSEYQDYDAANKIIGIPHLGEESESVSGSLLKQIRSQPFSVILLDELEKAHPNVFDLFLQMFDDGRLSDASGQTTNFTQSIVIMTSNVGNAVGESGPIGFAQEDSRAAAAEEEVQAAVRALFRPELINRIDQFVQFKPLDAQAIRTIAKRELGQVLMRQGITRRQLRIDVDPGVVDIVARKGFDPEFGARPLKRTVERLVLRPLARELSQTTADNRPALIRMTASGDAVTLKTIHDRQTRKSESIERGVVIKNRAGKITKVKPREIQQALITVSEGLKGIEDQYQHQDLATRKTELIAQTGAIGLWDDPVRAREVMTDLYRLERLEDAIGRLNSRARRLAEDFESAHKQRDDQRLRRIAQEIVSVLKHIEVIDFSLRCETRIDRCDAFVTIRAIDDEARQDIAGNLADMYLHWADRKGFVARVVHEELFSPKRTRELILLIEGVAICGLLRNEDGIHEFIYGKTSQLPRRSHFVHVRVAPIFDEAAFDDSRIRIQVRKRSGTGQRCKRLRTEILATDVDHGAEVRIVNDLSEAEARKAAVELIAAEAERVKIEAEAEAGGSEVVRRYTLTPSQSARDTCTHVTVHNLRELWNGALDPFLAGAVARRRNRSDGKARSAD
jgi:ATP-dependent Clp protease ATP-binding subunit ClpC